jgi:hypothetical protein
MGQFVPRCVACNGQGNRPATRADAEMAISMLEYENACNNALIERLKKLK